MSKTENTFVWYELMTSDTDDASAFYQMLFNWEIAEQNKEGGHSYLGLSNGGGDGGFGGVQSASEGVTPHWVWLCSHRRRGRPS